MPPTPTPTATIDLAAHAATLGDPADYFVHFEAELPLVVRHATGTPEYAFAPDGGGLVSLTGPGA